jgi:hypothetical protein
MKLLAVTGALMGLTMLVTGCTSPPGSAPVVVTDLTSSAPASEPPAATVSPAPQGVGSASPATYPATAKAYAQAILAAWKAKQQTALASLTTSQVEDQIISIPLPNMTWTFIRCDGAAGSSHCAFYNNDGDVINLRISNTQLGKADAGTAVTFEQTSLPNEAKAYVQELLEAWRDDNGPRMRRLAKLEVVVVLAEGVALKSWTIKPIACCGGGLAIVEVDAPNGAKLKFHVGTTLLGQEKAVIDLG